MKLQAPNSNHQLIYKFHPPVPRKTSPCLLVIWSLVINWILIIGYGNFSYAEEAVQPLIINGDRVEYSTDAKEVTASGNVEIIYKGARLTCQRLVVNTETKQGFAEGNARIDDVSGTVIGQKISYNFLNKTGVVMDANFRANPYFGVARKVEKVSDKEFMALHGYATTCSYDHPHYRIKSKKIDIFPGDKIITKNDIFFLGSVPVASIPEYNHSLKDPLMHVQLFPGKTSDWGGYLLTSWRYNLAEALTGRIYVDYRNNLGFSEGLGGNYNSALFGKGDIKYYYTRERDKRITEGPNEFTRYLARWRHQWDIAPSTNVTAEFNKIKDSKRMVLGTSYNFLQEYFYREYEKDEQPLTYVTAHHSFDYAGLDFIFQKRVNSWYTQLEMLPKLQFTMPTVKLWNSPFYFENITQGASYKYKYAETSTGEDWQVSRMDMVNKLSLPVKLAFFSVTPFAKDEETYYSRGINDDSHSKVRSIYSTGVDISTKFYKYINFNSRFLGMEFNGLRHVITPTIAYDYTHKPTVLAEELFQADATDNIASSSNTMNLQLSNKLQTKRSGQSVDVVDFLVTTDYVFKNSGSTKQGGNFSDFIFKLKVLPASWIWFEGEATFDHTGRFTDPNYNRFSDIDFDLNFDIAKDRSFGIGQRYQRKGSNEIVGSFTWRFNPKWMFSLYQRYEIGHDYSVKRGIKEQQYTITRDLHCWDAEFTYNVDKYNGHSVWLVFRLKAFPELNFNVTQSYHQPKSGSQSNP